MIDAVVCQRTNKITFHTVHCMSDLFTSSFISVIFCKYICFKRLNHWSHHMVEDLNKYPIRCEFSHREHLNKDLQTTLAVSAILILFHAIRRTIFGVVLFIWTMKVWNILNVIDDSSLPICQSGYKVKWCVEMQSSTWVIKQGRLIVWPTVLLCLFKLIKVSGAWSYNP